MAFQKGSLEEKQDIKEYTDDLEDRVEEGFDLTQVSVEDLEGKLDISLQHLLEVSLSPKGTASNLNDAIDTGVYETTSASINAPSSPGLLITVNWSNNRIVQLWFHWNVVFFYVRTRWNGTWSDWRDIITGDRK